MNLQVLSDIHLETFKDGGVRYIDSLEPQGVDVLILAGDITTWQYPTTAAKQIALIAQKYKNVIYVLGNHELWRHGWASPYRAAAGIEATIQGYADNVFVLYGGKQIHIDGQRFLGDTGWFPSLQVQQQYLMQGWPDFELIRGLAENYGAHNAQLRRHLLAEATHDDVVITHHIPSTLGIAPRWRGNPSNVFFYAGYDQVILEKQPKLWIFGHTHDPRDVMHGETRLLCNPRDYAPKLQRPAGFQEKLIVSV